MIYLWAIPGRFPNKLIGVYNRDLSFNRFLLNQGRVLLHSEISSTPSVDFIVSKEKLLPYDCLPNNSLIPLVNSRLKNLLEPFCKQEIQFIPANVVCTDGVLDEYYFINATRTFTGIDKEKSIYTTFKDSDDILRFNYLTYKPNCMEGLHIARDSEYFVNLMVDEKIYSLFKKEKIKGVLLSKPEDHFKPINELL